MTKYLYFPTAISVGLFCVYWNAMTCHSKIRDLSLEGLTNYDSIRNLRSLYFGIGVGIAVLITILYWYIFRSENSTHAIIDMILILLVVPILVYLVLPKFRYLLQSPDLTKTQTQKWFRVYLCMKNNFLYAFLFGFLLTVLILFLMDYGTEL